VNGLRKYDVAAYLWPAYHFEPRAEGFWPERDGEWYTVRRGTPRFPGHDMPRVPLLGYQDEADPEVMRQHVRLALDHGVNIFIVDWYWYDQAPCFERQLNEGLIPALEGTAARFYLMWANHEATTLWNMHTDEDRPVWTARVSRSELEPLFDRLVERYLSLDVYYRLEDRPVLSLYDFANFEAGLGGARAARDALGWMRRRAVEHGLPGLHLQTIARRDGRRARGALGADAGFDSATSYQFVHDARGEGDYVGWAAKAMAAWDDHERAYGRYFPQVSVGWDNTQRMPSARTAVTGATPDAFEACLWRARRYLDARPDCPPLVVINSWNEWTEGSYLLPDLRWGYRYLRAVRNVFGGPAAAALNRGETPRRGRATPDCCPGSNP